MTRRNRVSLTRMERQILRILIDTSYEPLTALKSKDVLQKRTIVKKVMIHRVRYHRHITRRPIDHILRVASRYKIEGKRKVGRPCFIWEDTLAKETRKVGISHLLENFGDELIDMKEIEETILAGNISEEESDG